MLPHRTAGFWTRNRFSKTFEGVNGASSEEPWDRKQQQMTPDADASCHLPVVPTGEDSCCSEDRVAAGSSLDRDDDNQTDTQNK